MEQEEQVLAIKNEGTFRQSFSMYLSLNSPGMALKQVLCISFA